MKKAWFIMSLLFPLMSAYSSMSLAHFNVDQDPTINFPRPGQGNKIVPLAEMDLPKELKTEIAQNLNQLKTQYYVESSSSYPNQLLYMG